MSGEDGRLTLTVSELNEAVRGLLESDLRFRNLCVEGELSNYKIYPSGHHYFTLKDQESSLKCVMFRSSAARLRFRPENGMRVFAGGSLRVYPRDGAYQLYCTTLVPDGVGDLQVAFEQLKQRLYAEGLFDEAHKKPLPAFPSKIAVITSSAGAAVHDMIRILRPRATLNRFPKYFLFFIFLLKFANIISNYFLLCLSSYILLYFFHFFFLFLWVYMLKKTLTYLLLYFL